jgi:serine/threonine-protein kinase
MELFGAGTLEERLRRSSFLNVDDVTAVLEPLADAIDYAHGRRLLHRDIKPSNILFTDSGRPVLSDFGIAHVLPSRESTIGPGFETIFGTAEYMAPEVMQEAPPSPASDIYSLGMTVYFALSGKFPTDGGTPFTRSRARVEGHLVPLMQRNPAVSAPVSHAVMTAIATEPGSRYKSARAFAAALRVSASVAPEGWHPPPEPVQESAPRRERAPGPQSTPKAEVASDAPRKKSWLDYWRYVVVPIVIAIVSAIASWLSRKN